MAGRRGKQGQLDERISLLSPVRSPDEHGQEVERFVEYASCWGGLRSLTGREVMTAREPIEEITHRVEIRWRPGVVGGHRVRLQDGRELAIIAALDEDGRRMWLTILAREVRR